GRSVFHFLARGIAPLLIGAVVFRLHLGLDPVTWLGFVASVFLGVVVSFGLRYLVALLTFWLMDAVGVQQIASIVGMFLSGMMLPLTVLPHAVGSVAAKLPWSATLQIPADVLLGKTDLLWALQFEGIWALVLLVAGRVLSMVATRRVVVQGG